MYHVLYNIMMKLITTNDAPTLSYYINVYVGVTDQNNIERVIAIAYGRVM